MSKLDIRPIGQDDMSEIVDMQARVWQDHFLKEKNQHVPMMRRSLKNINYYLEKEPEGCFVAVWDGKIAGSIISHVWGKVGWFGPLEVEATLQNQGIGKALVQESLNYMKEKGCTTRGCETMATSPKNIAFYLKMGFRARGMSNVLYKRLEPVDPDKLKTNEARFFEARDTAHSKGLWQKIQPGLDYSTEIEATHKHKLGEIWALDSGAHAIVHTYEMFSDSNNAIVKLLIAQEKDTESMNILLEKCELSATLAGKTGMFIRAYDATPPGLKWLSGKGYVLQSNSIRLIFEGADESGKYNHVSCWSG
ncbi:MAG: GNAT family N-acetyltransferase [Thermoplasmata archaeon]|nr:GNAT family N-acetyltransferase [Thermoplasmata archaeon]